MREKNFNIKVHGIVVLRNCKKNCRNDFVLNIFWFKPEYFVILKIIKEIDFKKRGCGELLPVLA